MRSTFLNDFISLLFVQSLSIHLGFLSVSCFDLVEDYSGPSFFDEWDFYGSWDNLTLGDVNWLDRVNATNKRLAFVNSAGNAILKVDNVTNVIYLDKRDSVRITTQRQFGLGSLWIADIVHMPFGCSVWPALWTKGPAWPEDGEIDIIEGINLMQNNQMALHTREGCTHVNPAPPTQRGKSNQLDCHIDAGCTVIETASNSFGAGFNSAGGGVYATQFDASGIYIWFWSRANIPKSILESTSTSALTSLDDWGPPAASYPSGSNCNIPTYFAAQSIVLDITLCGTWAGVPSLYTPQCAAQGPSGKCYEDNVPGPGAKYDTAYFEVKYIRAYASPGTPASSATSSVVASKTIQNADSTSSTSPNGAISSNLIGSALGGSVIMLAAAMMICLL